jgi:hypothetical protein
MTFSLPPVAKAAMRLACDIEEAVAAFPRKHRYSFGADLRLRAWNVVRTTNRAFRDAAHRGRWIEELQWTVDELKDTLILGKQLAIFASFNQFEDLARKAAEVGRQVGGWLQHQHPKGQDGQARAPSQRAKTLSTRAASAYEANQ